MCVGDPFNRGFTYLASYSLKRDIIHKFINTKFRILIIISDSVTSYLFRLSYNKAHNGLLYSGS